MTSAFSWQNSISLCLAWFYTPRPNLPVTPGVSRLPTFAFQSPIMKRTSFLGVSSRSCRSSRTVQLQLLQHSLSGHRLGLLCYWMVCLGNEQRSFCLLHVFWSVTFIASSPAERHTSTQKTHTHTGNKLTYVDTNYTSRHRETGKQGTCLFLYLKRQRFIWNTEIMIFYKKISFLI